MLGIKHKIIRLSSDKPPNVVDLVKAFAEPFACASALGMLEISKEVKKSGTVLLTGDGGDDIFLGHPEHKHFFLTEKVNGCGLCTGIRDKSVEQNRRNDSAGW